MIKPCGGLHGPCGPLGSGQRPKGKRKGEDKGAPEVGGERE